MDLQLRGLSAVVTGGSSGIGAAIVDVLAAEGCSVSFCGRTAATVAAALQRTQALPAPVRGEVVDVTQADRFDAWLAGIGAFDIFIANVSALSNDWDATVATDIRATVANVDAALPYLQRSQHAAVTYIGSKAGSLAAPGGAAYGAAKAAMAHTMKSLSARLLPAVRVNTVSPGDTLVTDGFWGRVQRDEPDAFARVVARNPLGRLATAHEVARVVAFISSPAASFVAGANWYVDGGSTQHVQF